LPKQPLEKDATLLDQQREQVSWLSWSLGLFDSRRKILDGMPNLFLEFIEA
jgi:hypothetical protein